MKLFRNSDVISVSIYGSFRYDGLMNIRVKDILSGADLGGGGGGGGGADAFTHGPPLVLFEKSIFEDGP